MYSLSNVSSSADLDYSMNMSSNFYQVEIREFDDGVYISFGGEPFNAESHDANVQIWRDKDGRIVAIDIFYDEP
ncbi:MULTISPECIES: hypothetical protein [Acidianus]|uniref:Uncharacterized protein n=1 Tax=Candidatus Acidianus copahuensis TaxID=1160895 RepID=A0A031LUC8_9CREN|nr:MULTISPECIES: hypothetical protein [Acidianus]EZQ11375.1 hypothetical protein CM19_01435 [Candidatus Acidianus copahuensis]NON61462.1 hypothetical protein [Acidianus sp. RZ1]